MTKANISSDDKALLAGWVDFGDGVHATRSPQIIQQALKTIQRQHIFCTVVAKGYESGKLALVKFGAGRIVLDRPVDWPSGMKPQPLRIIFKDRAQLWNQLAVKLQEVTDDSLVTTMPVKYVCLQRRNNYRVEAPRGSRVRFLHQGGEKEFGVEDVSANGGLFGSGGRKQELAIGDSLTGIMMKFPVADDDEVTVRIKEGRVVRSCENDHREVCFGVQFLIQGREEQDLMQYVRLRERELLRKGMAD